MVPQFVEATSFSLDSLTKGKTGGRKRAKKGLTQKKDKFSLRPQCGKKICLQSLVSVHNNFANISCLLCVILESTAEHAAGDVVPVSGVRL